MFDKMNGVGAHEVIIETPEHALTLAEMPEHQIKEVLWAYKERICDLKNDRRFRYIMLFKNHGEAAGASLEHPHSPAHRAAGDSQAGEGRSGRREAVLRAQGALHLLRHHPAGDRGRGPAGDAANRDFMVIPPYAPRFPFETWMLPKQHESHFEDSTRKFASLARMLKDRAAADEHDAAERRRTISSCTARRCRTSRRGEFYHWHVEIMPKLTEWPDSSGGPGFTSIRRRPRRRRTCCVGSWVRVKVADPPIRQRTLPGLRSTRVEWILRVEDERSAASKSLALRSGRVVL